MIDIKKLAELSRQTDTELKIGRQITLPWGNAFKISMRNVTLRLGRAAITASGVVLGIAFLMSVWTSRVAIEGIERFEQQSARAVSAMDEEGNLIGPGAEEALAEKNRRNARQNWLVVMSLLVCTVGITNSMLMSVTERFREIGTMKCLGALDVFIVRLFLIETAFLGFLGSVVGVIIGHVIMLIAYTIKDHSVAAKMDWGEMLMYVLIALAIGTFLSFIAAIPPAVRAARMPPAAALQTEI
ncbi:MAG: FtsX-like permease family protein [Armatimonadetes bacterium]|nr:FtsX-like permease family protein [Armatimonadota bacterium]